MDEERFWFRGIVAAEQDVINGLDDAPEDVWQVGAVVSAAALLELYRQEIERANVIITATPLCTAPAWWPNDLFGDWRLNDLREVIMHMIAETACRAGHLDVARELIDGRSWLVLTE